MPRLRPNGTHYPSMRPQTCDYCRELGTSSRMVFRVEGVLAHKDCRPPLLCSKAGCDQPRKGRGLCSSHYNRWHYNQKPEAMRERARRWAADNPEKRAALAARRKAEGRATEASRRWYWANRLRAIASQHNQRARRLGVPGVVTAGQLRGRLQVFGGRCYLCGGTPKGFDHVKPIAAGGPNFASNLRPVCIGCNNAKGSTWKETA